MQCFVNRFIFYFVQKWLSVVLTLLLPILIHFSSFRMTGEKAKAPRLQLILQKFTDLKLQAQGSDITSKMSELTIPLYKHCSLSFCFDSNFVRGINRHLQKFTPESKKCVIVVFITLKDEYTFPP